MPSSMHLKILAVAAVAVSSAPAEVLSFSFIAPLRTGGAHATLFSQRIGSALFSSDDQPSDSAIVETEDSEPEYAQDEPVAKKESLVSSVLGDLADGKIGPGKVVGAATRSNVNEALIELEKTFTEENPAMSKLINGVWSLRYVGGYSNEWALASPTRQLALFLYSGGYSPGLYALSLASQLPSSIAEVGDVAITISRSPQPRIEARVAVSVFGQSSDVVVRADLDVESGVRFLETYRDVTVAGQQLDVPEALRYSREMFVTYVDEDILVVRDGSGVPEVLVRKEMDFMKNWGFEPDEMPGATA